MSAVPDAAIEAAAEAIRLRGDDPVEDARAAIEAAMPAIREAIAQEIDAYDGPRHNYWLDLAARIVRGGYQ